MTTHTATSGQGPVHGGHERPQEPPQSQPGWSFLRSRRWLGYYVLLVIFCIVCVWLADWQFDRRADARAEIARIEQNYDAAAIPLDDAVPDPAGFDEDALKWQTATVRGEYLGNPFLARNRPGPEGVGSHLLQALRTDQGLMFIVDRGWVPVNGNEANAGDAWLDSIPAAPTGPVEVDVRLRASEPQIAGRLAQGSTVASINLPEIARIGGFDEAYTGAYGMLIGETPKAETGVLPEPPERDEGPHLSYALQWYVFILIAAFGVVYAARQEHRGLNAGSEAVLRQQRRAAARKARRGTTDAEEEDAFLEQQRSPPAACAGASSRPGPSKGAGVEIALWITQLLIMSALIAVIGVAGAPPRDSREDPTVREELDDFVYRSRRLGSRLKRRWQQRGRRKKRPPRR